MRTDLQRADTTRNLTRARHRSGGVHPVTREAATCITFGRAAALLAGRRQGALQNHTCPLTKRTRPQQLGDALGCSSSDMEDVSQLFVNVDYREACFDLGDGIKQTCLCLDAACTDHDLTGQVVWPVSVLLAAFVARSDEFRAKRCLEIGAGCGLPGLTAAARSGCVVALTDGSDIVLDLLHRTVKELGSPASVKSLLWGDRSSAEAFVRDFGRADFILGADVVAWPQSIEPLFQTISFVGSQTAVFYCGFVCRAANIRDLFYTQATRYGFRISSVEISSFLPDTPPPDIASSTLPLQLLRLDRAQSQQPAPCIAFLSDDPIASENSRPAC